ncbi:MAG: PAS domain-containing protein [Opitutus sp.]|nr:PAS domain-containing protein [Opitutus sp.]
MKDKTIQTVLTFFAVISAVFIVVAVAAVRNINRSAVSSDEVNHTHAVILEAETLLLALHAADGAARTYVVTGDARDRSACLAAVASVAEHFEVAKALTHSEPAQSQQFAQVETLINQHGGFVRELLAARQAGDMEAARPLLAADAGGEALRSILRKMEKLKLDEMALLADRDRAAYLQAQTTRWTVWLGVALDVLLLGGAGWLIKNDIASRRRAAAALLQANDQLEAKVSERTAELTAANAQLTADNMERQWANQALEHQLRYGQLIINSISDLVFVLTKAMNISRVNPAVTHLTGLGPADLINQPLSRLVRLLEPPPGAEVPLFDPISQALKDGRDLRDLAAVIEDKRGRRTSVRLGLFPLRDRDKVVGAVVTLQVSEPTHEPRS